MKLKLAVLISGRGSNLKSLIDACAAKDFPAEIALVISNKQNAPGLNFAKKAGIPMAILDHKKYDSREEFDKAMSAEIEKSGAKLVCLAGFMRLLSPWFVEKWHNKLINIHPSLLPAFKGIDVHKRVLESGVKTTGCTVHFVRPEMDSGPIIAQAEVPVFSGDTEEKIAARVLAEEHKCYPAAVKLIAEGRVEIKDERVLIREKN